MLHCKGFSIRTGAPSLGPSNGHSVRDLKVVVASVYDARTTRIEGAHKLVEINRWVARALASRIARRVSGYLGCRHHEIADRPWPQVHESRSDGIAPEL